MTTTDPALKSLLIFLNVVPIALYFLYLGLLNSNARPRRVSSRCDFLTLTTVVVPLLFWPVPALAVHRLWWLLAIGLALVGWAFVRLLPARDAGWVVYNVSEGRWRSAIVNALESVGLSGDWKGRTWREQHGRLTLAYSTFPLLRNISVTIDANETEFAHLRERLGESVDRQLARYEQLPSFSGACLWLLGVSLMVFPLWIMGRHAHDVVAAVARLFG